MAGQVVMQGFIRRRIPIFVRRAITLAPALLVLAIGFNPTDALVVSQVVLSFGIPFALVPLLLIARDREVMGALANPRWLSAVSRALLAAMIIALNVFLLVRALPLIIYALARCAIGRAISSRCSTRCRPTGRTSSSTCGSGTRARYIDTAVALSQVNAQPYSRGATGTGACWSPTSFGHAAAAERSWACSPEARRGGGRAASSRSARSARAAPRSSRCGAGRRACARSSASAARSSGRSLMARVVAVAADLLLGSKVEAMLSAAGHDVDPVLRRWPRLTPRRRTWWSPTSTPRTPRRWSRLGVPVIGYYSHVEVETRRAAEAAGVLVIVPRSRMVRELPELAASVLSPEA